MECICLCKKSIKKITGNQKRVYLVLCQNQLPIVVLFLVGLLIALGIIWGLSFMGVELALRSYTPLTIATFRIVLQLFYYLHCVFLLVTSYRVSDKNGKRILLHCLGMGLFSNAIPFTLLSWGQINVSSSFAGISMAVVP